MASGVTLTGFAEYRRNLREAPKRVQELAGYITEDAGTSMGRGLKAEFPEGPTGNLRRGVRVEQIGPYNWRVRSTARHTHLVEEGTGRRFTKGTGAFRGVMPASHIFVPLAVRTRALMVSRLEAMVERETGATIVRGGVGL